MVNFRERKITLCGKELRIKDTKVADLENALKPVEKIEQELMEKQDEMGDINEELNELRVEANDIAMQREDKLNLSRKLLNKFDLTNDDLIKAETLQETAADLKKQFKKLTKEIKKQENILKTKLNEFKKYNKDILPTLRLEQGKACELLLEDITKEEFVKEYRLRDIVVVENLSPIIEMHLNNVSQDKISQKITELAAKKHDTSFR